MKSLLNIFYSVFCLIGIIQLFYHEILIGLSILFVSISWILLSCKNALEDEDSQGFIYVALVLSFLFLGLTIYFKKDYVITPVILMAQVKIYLEYATRETQS